MNMNEKQKAERTARINALCALAGDAAGEYIGQIVRTEAHSRSDAETNADDLDDAAMDVADKIRELYDALPSTVVKCQPFVDFAEGVLERVTEAMDDTDAANYLDAAAVYYLFKNHDIDIQEERDNRRARIDAQIAVHSWYRRLDGTAYCRNCNANLNGEQAKRCFHIPREYLK